MREAIAPVYVVDDDLSMRESVAGLLRSAGLSVATFASAHEFLARPGSEIPSCIVLDVKLPGLSGLELQQELARADVHIPIIFLTGHGDIGMSVRAMKAGALEFLTKPFDAVVLLDAIQRAIDRHHKRRAAVETPVGQSIIGNGPAMQRLLDTVARVAPKDITILVRGETGTGKELVASLIHAQSRREGRPLVRFNCAAIPAELAEAELFGHVRGAFTGAVQARRGFFAEADTGTLVLDEVGELPLPVQAKLLRALQEGEIQPVGAARVDRVDVRVVACTNRDLAEEVRAGRFREDLYYRLRVLELLVPPLREHREDIPALAAEFARRHANRFGVDEVRIKPKLLEALQQMPWRGNVRELENAMACMVALSDGSALGIEALAAVPAPAADSPVSAEGSPAGGTLNLREQIAAVERWMIGRTMNAVGGNQSEAARRLGLSRGSLIERLKKYGPMAS